MRVPSANLSCIEVVGRDESTTKPNEGDGAVVLRGVVVAVGSPADRVELSPPIVLPTPWKAVLRFGGSCTNKGLSHYKNEILTIYRKKRDGLTV